MAGIKEYWQELAAKAGVPADRMAAITEALGDEIVAKAFQQGFVTRSDYSRDLDKIRDDTAKPLKEKVDQYDKWYKEVAEPAYRINAGSLEKLRKYEELHGPLEDGDQRRAATATGMTKEEITKYMDEREQASNSRTSYLLKNVPRLVSKHVREFGEEPDLDAIEKLAVEKGYNLDQAYREYSEPKYEAKRTAELDTRIKREREEAIRDYASKHKLPVESKQRDAHPFFDRKEASGKTPREMEQAGKNAFFDVMNDPNWKEKAS